MRGVDQDLASVKIEGLIAQSRREDLTEQVPQYRLMIRSSFNSSIMFCRLILMS